MTASDSLGGLLDNLLKPLFTYTKRLETGGAKVQVTSSLEQRNKVVQCTLVSSLG